ncbi:hypothetical protein V8C35DRAFT_71967 [Trichoderma chlorosporum]
MNFFFSTPSEPPWGNDGLSGGETPWPNGILLQFWAILREAGFWRGECVLMKPSALSLEQKPPLPRVLAQLHSSPPLFFSLSPGKALPWHMHAVCDDATWIFSYRESRVDNASSARLTSRTAVTVLTSGPASQISIGVQMTRTAIPLGSAGPTRRIQHPRRKKTEMHVGDGAPNGRPVERKSAQKETPFSLEAFWLVLSQPMLFFILVSGFLFCAG